MTGGFIDCEDDDGNYLRKPSAVDLTEAFKLSPFYSDLSLGMRCSTYCIYILYTYIHTYIHSGRSCGPHRFSPHTYRQRVPDLDIQPDSCAI